MLNFFRYRVDEEDKCDPTITSIFGDDIFWRRDLTCYPNPVRDQLKVELPEHKRGQLVVVDLEGQLVHSEDVYDNTLPQSISMSYLQSGTYSVEYICEKNKERRIWTSRVVKID